MTNIVCLCDKRPDADDGIDIYKDFVQLIRRKEFEEPYILVTDDTTQKLKDYVRLLLDIKLADGHYHVHFGQVKNLINSFLNFHTSVMEDVIKECDTYTNESVKDDLLFLVEYTISVHQTKQVNFGKDFLPVNTPWEKRTYIEIEALYEDYLKKLQEIRDYIHSRLDRQPKVYEFAKAHFQITARKMSDTFDTAHLFMGMLLAERVRETRLSLEEILRRLRKNLTSNRQEREKAMYQLVTDLYERNKESMVATRRDKTNSAVELAEANRSIDILRNKIANYEIEIPAIARLEEEVAYWATQLDYFNEIANNLDLLKKQQEETDKQQREYHLLKCKQLLECRRDCKRVFRALYSQRMEDIRMRIINETRALVTFFAVRDRRRPVFVRQVRSLHREGWRKVVPVCRLHIQLQTQRDQSFRQGDQGLRPFREYQKEVSYGDYGPYQSGNTSRIGTHGYKKHRMTTSEIEQKEEEAGKYREEIFKDRKERAEAAARKWRSRQVKRRKPEESDDSETRAHYDAKVAEELFILSLNQDY